LLLLQVNCDSVVQPHTMLGGQLVELICNLRDFWC